MHILVSVVIIVSVMAYFFYASYSIRACIYMRVFCCKKTEEKIIAITFDDGPDPIQTPKVLKVLREKHIPACFFCIGNKIKGNEELLRQIIKEGHRIGNHSFSHSGYFPLYTFKRMCHDLITCQQELEKVTGQPVRWFRPPFGGPMRGRAMYASFVRKSWARCCRHRRVLSRKSIWNLPCVICKFSCAFF